MILIVWIYLSQSLRFSFTDQQEFWIRKHQSEALAGNLEWSDSILRNHLF